MREAAPGCVVVVRHLDLRVPRAEDPLIEERLEVPAGLGFERAAEVVRVDEPPRMRLDVAAQPPEEELVAQLEPEVMDHAAGLLVEVAIEDVDRRLVRVRHDRAPVLVAALLDVVPRRLEEVVGRALARVAVLVPEDLGVGREAFVQPGMGPVAAREQVAEPLVRRARAR